MESAEWSQCWWECGDGAGAELLTQVQSLSFICLSFFWMLPELSLLSMHMAEFKAICEQ